MTTNAEIKKMGFKRSRGLIWVCDIVNSSKFLNDNKSVNVFEKFLRRFYLISSKIVNAAEGSFVKWTGDGFLAWFEIPLNRDLSDKTLDILNVIWHTTVLLNVTQLGIKNKPKFKIRHALTYEQDALVIQIESSDQKKSIDLIGRSVVLAFRLSSIHADFPNLITHKEVIDACKGRKKHINFKKLKFSKDEKLKYFKGEKWSTNTIYISSDKEKSIKRSPNRIIASAEKTLSSIKNLKSMSEKENFAYRLLMTLSNGPKWCDEVKISYINFLWKFHKTAEKLLEVYKKTLNLTQNQISRQ